MSLPGSADSGTGSSLFLSLRSFWGVLIAILHTRLDLVTMELEEEARRAAQLVLIGLAALLCAAMTLFFLLFFLVVALWDERVIVLSIISVVGLLATAALAILTRQMFLSRPKFLSQTIAELRRDVEGFRTHVEPKTGAPRP